MDASVILGKLEDIKKGYLILAAESGDKESIAMSAGYVAGLNQAIAVIRLEVSR